MNELTRLTIDYELLKLGIVDTLQVMVFQPKTICVYVCLDGEIKSQKENRLKNVIPRTVIFKFFSESIL